MTSPVPTSRLRRGEVFGYCMFDFANSSYTTLISTVAFSVYFRQAVVGGASGRGDFLWSVASVVAFAILILTSPVLGALADYSGRKKRFLLLTSAQTIISCALLWFVRPGDVALGMILFVVGGYVFYNAFLPEVSTPSTIGRVSGWSWGTGFIGGLIALAACMPLLARPLLDPDSGVLDPRGVESWRLSFVVVAAFFALFSVPTFLLLRERPTGRAPSGPRDYLRLGYRRVTDTLGHLRRYRQTARYVASALFFYGGIDVVIKFSAIYASVTYGFSGNELVLLFVFANVAAVPGTLLAGYVADWIGGKRALLVTLLLWFVLLGVAAFSSSKLTFWLLTAGIATGMGSTQAIGRSFMSQLSPPSRESEFFGFYLLCNKVGSILALVAFGAISWLTGGNQRLAVLATMPFFAIGLLLLARVDAAEGCRAARDEGA
jgi:UMF1 family MFS transporter